MKTFQRLRFSGKDIFSRRTFGHVAVGGLAVILGTTALLLSRSFENAVSIFIDECFVKVRPFVGSVEVRTSGKFISTADRKDLDRILQSERNVVCGVTEFAQMDKLEFCKDAKNDFGTTTVETVGMPRAKIEAAILSQEGLEVNESQWHKALNATWKFLAQNVLPDAMAFGNPVSPSQKPIQENFIFAPEMRVPFFRGGAEMWFEQRPEKTVGTNKILDTGDSSQGQRQFGVLMNATVLSEFYGWTSEEIDNLSRGIYPEDDSKNIPSEVYIEFGTIEGKKPNEDIKPGRQPVPVTGIFYINHNLYPHYILSPDALGAYYFQNKELWEPSYSTQFVRSDTKEPLVPFHEGLTPGRETIENFKTLPGVDELLKFKDQRKKGEEPFSKIILHLTEESSRSNERRRQLKVKLESPAPLFSTVALDPNLLTGLNNEKNPKSRTNAALEMFKKARDSGQIVPKLDEKKTRVSVAGDSASRQWEVVDESNDQKFIIRQGKNGFDVSKLSPWSVTLPDEEAGAALTRVDTIVKSYSQLIQTIVLNLSLLSVVLFGCAHYFRKRKDFGLLKACGLPAVKLGSIFVTQVLLVTLCGFFLGLGCAFLAAHYLEEPAQALVKEMNTTGFRLPNQLLTISSKVVMTTFGQIFIVGVLGALGPTLVVMMVRPINDLRAGV